MALKITGGKKSAAEKEIKSMDFNLLAAPAQRALTNAGINTLEQLSKFTEKEISALHGMGPNALAKLKVALQASGWSFKKA